MARQLLYMELFLNFFESNVLRFDKEEPYDEKLQDHHDGAERKRDGQAALAHGNDAGIYLSGNRAQSPVCKTAERLAFCADAIGENFADIDPDNRALGEGEKQDKHRQTPWEKGD